MQSAQNKLRALRPKLESFKSVNDDSPDSVRGYEGRPRIMQESEQLISRFDALDANIDTWVSQMESAAKQVKDFQVIQTLISATFVW